MSNQEAQMLSDIAVKVGKVEASQAANTQAIGDMAIGLNRLVDKLDESDDIAREAMLSTRSAHKRIDRIDKTLFWMGTTVIGAVILAVVKFAMDGKV